MRSNAMIPALLVMALLSACVTSRDGAVPGVQSAPEEASRYNVQLGLQYLSQGRRELAMEKLNRALEQDPRNPDAHTALAFAYDRFGEPALADAAYKRALRLSDDNPEIRNTYGVFLCRQGRLRDAERHLKAVAENVNYPTPEVAWTNAGVCAERIPDLNKAEDYFRRALKANARFPDALWSMAKLSHDTDDFLQARAFLQRYFEVAPRSAETLWLGYRIESALGDEETARVYATRLRTDFATSDEVRLLKELESGGSR